MRKVISASRRTDIPGFYMPWLERRIKQGGVDVRNPVMKHQKYHVSLKPEDVHSIVLWSKNYRPFLESALSQDERYRWYFNFSLVDCPQWERRVPGLDERLKQVREITKRWSARHINWRFDPIIYWDGGRRNNLNSFAPICDVMAGVGITRCTISFVTWYKKVKQRPAVQSLGFYDPPMEQKIDVLSRMSSYAHDRGITLESCCNDALLQAEGIKRASCVNGPLLTELSGERCSAARDNSQREGCGCTKSSDIGGYAMSCFHNCLYCYAKPVGDK